MENQLRIKRIVEWIFPYLGNKHIMPYGKLEVTDGTSTKIVQTRGDLLETWPTHECQYIVFNRHAYKVCVSTDIKTEGLKMWLEPID